MGTLNDASSYKLYDSPDFENLTGKFWLKYQNIILKRVEFKADGIKSISKIGEKWNV